MSLVWQTAATASPRCLPSSSTRQRSGSAGRRSTDSRWRSATHRHAGTWRGVSPKSLLGGGRLSGATTTAPNRLHPWGRGGSASAGPPTRATASSALEDVTATILEDAVVGSVVGLGPLPSDDRPASARRNPVNVCGARTGQLVSPRARQAALHDEHPL